MTKFKILFLYTELADYFLSAVALLHQQAEVKIIHWPIAKEAPFDFSAYQNLSLVNRENLNKKALSEAVRDYRPDVIVCSGWIDKDYLKVAKSYFGKIPTVLILDNHWKGSWKQQLATLASPFTLQKTFSHVWVPGNVQQQYALKLGFPESRISRGFYCANTKKFEDLYTPSEQKVTVSKRFLYLGRYVEHKGIFDLWTAFRRYRERGGDWDLLCVGTGDQWENREESEGITHLGFKQPAELLQILKDGGVYILPSHFEPWGVSVHEMAAAGFPMILSDKVGAKETFLEEGENGFTYPSGNVNLLLEQMNKITQLTTSELKNMASKSHEFSKRITPEKWVETVLNFLK